MENPGNNGDFMDKSWNNHRKTWEKIAMFMRKSWENHGEVMGKSWVKIAMGKSLGKKKHREINGKNDGKDWRLAT